MLVYCPDHGFIWRVAKRCPACAREVVPVPLSRFVLIGSATILAAALLIGVIGPRIRQNSAPGDAVAHASNSDLTAQEMLATKHELLERDLKIWRLYACYNEAQDRIRISGKLARQSGEWKAVTLGFVFRGPNNVANQQQNYDLPDVSKTTPLRPGIVREFSFEIPKFARPWEEHHVVARIESADPVE